MDDAARVLPTLFIGRAPSDPEDIASLKRRGITAVLSLQTDEDLVAMGLSWAQVEQWCETDGLETHRVPIEDWSPQAMIARMDEAVAALHRFLETGHTVFLHCTAGVNRSPSVALGYLRKIRKEPLGKALRRITRSRPQASPYPEVLAALR